MAALGLTALGHDAEGRARDDEVEQAPEPDDQHQAGDARLVEVAPRGRRAARRQRPEDREERPRQPRQVVAVEPEALVGDGEARLAGRQHHRDDGAGEVDALHVLVEFGDPRPAHVAVEVVLHHHVGDHVGRRVDQRLVDRGDEDLHVEEDVQQRREHEDQARQREEPEGHARQVAEPLDRLQAALEQRILQEHDLEHALAPACPLADEVGEGLGLEAGDQRPVDIGAGPSAGVQLEGGLAILRDRDAREPADRVEGAPPEERGRAAEERAVPLVEAGLRDPVEHLVLGRHPGEGPQVPLDRVRVDEDVRGLHQEQLRVAGEQAHGLPQERPERRVVGVEHQNEVGAGLGQAVVEVAGLGVRVARPGQVADAQPGAERLQRGAAGPRRAGPGGVRVGAFLVRAAVVQQPDGGAAGRVVEVARRRQREAQDLGGFVVGRNEDVDGGKVRLGQDRRGAAGQRRDVDDQADREDQHAVEFRQRQHDAEPEADGIVEGRQRAGHPPVGVTDDHGRAERQEGHPGEAPAGEQQPEREHPGSGGGAEHALGRQAHRLRQEAEGEGGAERPGRPQEGHQEARARRRGGRDGARDGARDGGWKGLGGRRAAEGRRAGHQKPVRMSRAV